MAGSQKNRPVDPGIEDNTTFEDRQFGRLHDPVSVMFDNVGDFGYTIKVDGVPATNLTDGQIFKAIEELTRFMDEPLKLHDPKPLPSEEVDGIAKEHEGKLVLDAVGNVRIERAHQVLAMVIGQEIYGATVGVNGIRIRIEGLI